MCSFPTAKSRGVKLIQFIKATPVSYNKIMIRFVRQTSYYVPRKLRGLIILICLVMGIVGMLVVLHLVAMIVGTGSHETLLTERDIENSIPKRRESQLFLKMEKLKAAVRYKELADQLHQTSSNMYNKLTQARSNLLESSRIARNITSKACRPLHFNTVLFMRIPKCASTSFVVSMKNLTSSHLSASSSFVFHFNPSGAYNWDDKTKHKVANFITHQHLINNNKSYLMYARHFYFVDFSSHFPFTYITIVRDPVSRIVSSYLYYHFSSKPHIQAILDPNHKNESLATCLKFSHEGCTPNLMTKYFCGHEKMCGSGSDKALRKAKENIMKHFAVVGLMEDLKRSYQLFKVLLPQYLGNWDIGKALSKINSNEHSMTVSAETRHKIEALNRADVLLYSFVQKRFSQQLLDCKILN